MVTCSRCGAESPEGFRFCGSCGSPLAPAAAEARKRVTILFSDLVESTPLGERVDPEALRRAMARFFELTRGVLESHGGTVEKFIGDAVMAVFGVPQLHEDDALRAVRAAVEARERLETLNLELEESFGVSVRTRTGINTGEVVVGEGETLVTGDAVNLAARLEQAAGSSEILIGAATYELVRDAVEAEKLAPLALKGKSGAITAFRLVALRPGRAGFERRHDSPLVGRERELRLFRDAFEQAVAGRSCHLVTVLGQPGVGKTRLVDDFVAQLEPSARVARGRCLPYGDGITYWPLRELVMDLISGSAGDVRSRLTALAPDAQAGLAADRVLALGGLADGAVTAEDGHRAVRKLFEALAHSAPLIAVLDDVQWAEHAFLDLVEHLADWSRDAPILLVCIGRPELLEVRPGWGGGKLNALSSLLNPLEPRDTETLIDNLLGGRVPDELRERVVRAAEGNPLYVEELVRVLEDSGAIRRRDGAWEVDLTAAELVVPPTIHALLAARLDALPPAERATLGAAAVEGKVFHLAAVDAIGPKSDARQHLGALVRKELIRPHAARLESEEAFSFHHQLVRDAAYDALPKSARSDLHERYADWLGQRAGTRRDVDEIVGYHLEQAHRYRVDVTPPDEQATELAGRAATLLGTAGCRAYGRGDVRAARGLLERASRLDGAAGRTTRRDLAETFAMALVWTGEIGRGIALLREAVATAGSTGDPLHEVRSRLALAEALMLANPDEAFSEMAWIETEAIPLLEPLGEDALLARAWHALSQRDWGACRAAETIAKSERAAAHARRAGDRRLELDTIGWVYTATLFGPAPVPEGIARCDTALAQESDLSLRHMALNARSGLLAYAGRFEEARADHARCLAILDELGRDVMAAVVSGHVGGLIEASAGDLPAAERLMRRGLDRLRAFGERSFLSTSAAQLADFVYPQGRLDEAEALTRESEAAGSADDISTQTAWRQVRAKVLARRREHPEAERLAREAVALIEPTDWLVTRATALDALAEVLELAGQATRRPRCSATRSPSTSRRGTSSTPPACASGSP